MMLWSMRMPENEVNLSCQRLEEDLIYAIRKFQQYAELHPVERNKTVVRILQEMLQESLKYQLEYSVLEEENKPMEGI